MPLFGQDTSFYDLMEAQAVAAQNEAKQFRTLISEISQAPTHAQKMKDIEFEADELIHKMLNRVDSTFVTPMDKEDLHALATSLDNITDALEAAGSRFTLYRVNVTLPDLVPMSDLLIQTTQAVYEATAGLRKLHNSKQTQDALRKIHELESEGDQLFRHALAGLFTAPDPNPLTVIVWKDIYERVEKAIDRCEQAANVIEGVVVKYA